MSYASGSVNSLRHSLIAFLLASLAACSTTTPVSPPPEPEATTEPPTVTEPVEVVEPVRRSTRISIAAVGDMMLGTDYPENHLPDDDGVSFLAGVAPWLRTADIAFGNLEGVLVDGGAGFDVLSLANNHARDFGEDGLTATMETLAAAGIFHSGREGDFASFEAKGLRIAVLAYAVTKNSNMLLDYARSEQTVREFAATHDVVIVSFHGGAEGRDVTRLPFAEEEYYDEPRGDVVRFARMVVDAGADLVIGHGPHVVRAMERYNDRLIAYSLGNFATYYGISVAGIKGVAPILTVTLDEEGRFIEGEIISTRQLRPAGPSLDPEDRALNLVRGLSIEDFGNPGLTFHPDGRVTPTDRPPVTRRTFPEDPP